MASKSKMNSSRQRTYQTHLDQSQQMVYKLDQTAPMSSTNGTSLSTGVKGQGLTLGPTWVTSSIERIRDWLKGGEDLTAEDFKQGCPRDKNSESLRKVLVFIKDDMRRRIEVQRQQQDERSNRLKSIYSSLQDIVKDPRKAHVTKKSSTDPDDNVLSDIEQLFIDTCRKQATNNFYETEIELLTKEVQNGIYDIEKATRRIQQENVKIKTELICIRKTLSERERATQCLSEEIECLERETKAGKYNNDKVVTSIEDMSEDLANIYTIRILLNERDAIEVKETKSNEETDRFEFASETGTKKAEKITDSYDKNGGFNATDTTDN